MCSQWNPYKSETARDGAINFNQFSESNDPPAWPTEPPQIYIERNTSMLINNSPQAIGALLDHNSNGAPLSDFPETNSSFNLIAANTSSADTWTT